MVLLLEQQCFIWDKVHKIVLSNYPNTQILYSNGKRKWPTATIAKVVKGQLVLLFHQFDPFKPISGAVAKITDGYYPIHSQS